MSAENLVPVLKHVLAHQDHITIRFPENKPEPKLAMRVPFHRIEIVLDGELTDSSLPDADNHLLPLHALYIPAKRWNQPHWSATPTRTLSILFGKQQLGFSLQSWNGSQFTEVIKCHVARLGPRVGSYLLLAMNELAIQPAMPTSRIVFTGLISHCIDQMTHMADTVTKSKELFMAIQEYIDENAVQPLSREIVAKKFHITPNYLSHLFQKAGSIGFNEYLTSVRLEIAKSLLRGYDLKIKEIAHCCGFEDSNYFCRIFKNHTARSPSEYRRHCRTM